MTTLDAYHTIGRPSLTESKVKGSRFIAESFLATSVRESRDQLQTVRKREHAASHHCYAYHIGLTDSVRYKYSDDGEPNGTAGRPIYDAITGHALTNLLVVVTRYFGGTKLGPGGLARAYGEAAQTVIERSGNQQHFVMARLTLSLEFAHYDTLRIVMERFNAETVQSNFADKVRLTVTVRTSRVKEFRETCIDLTSGRIDIEDATI